LSHLFQKSLRPTMVAQLTSAKMASTASKAMARRALRGRFASALHLTKLERSMDHSSMKRQSSSANSLTDATKQVTTVKLQSQSEEDYHPPTIVQLGTPLGAFDFDVHLRSDDSHDQRTASREGEETVALDSRTIANMLTLRKELLLLHKLLDTLQ
jgi:hypothetical protein